MTTTAITAGPSTANDRSPTQKGLKRNDPHPRTRRPAGPRPGGRDEQVRPVRGRPARGTGRAHRAGAVPVQQAEAHRGRAADAGGGAVIRRYCEATGQWFEFRDEQHLQEWLEDKTDTYAVDLDV